MAELKLNIYKGREVEKTYTAETYDIMTGTVEDVVQLVDVEKLVNSKSDTALVVEVVKIITGLFSTVKPILKDIFDGLTDEEIRHTKAKEVANLFINIVMFGMAEMKGTSDEKN